MSYSVTYGDEFLKLSKRKNKTAYRNAAILAIILLVGGVMLSVPKIRTSVRNFLLPGDGAVTAQAIEAFAVDMKSGAPFEEAAKAFCLEILHNG